jgi:hypothetical protein
MSNRKPFPFEVLAPSSAVRQRPGSARIDGGPTSRGDTGPSANRPARLYPELSTAIEIIECPADEARQQPWPGRD